MTCARARKTVGEAPRSYGYTIAINPPMKIVLEGDDIEGIGWVPRRRTVVVKTAGWYKYRRDAIARAMVMNAHADRTGHYFSYNMAIPAAA